MKQTRRIKRMTRGSRKKGASPGINLVSLMDVFTILVFFLLVNSVTSEILETPKNIKLPASVVEAQPRETIVVMITPEQILVQGEPVISIQEVLDSNDEIIYEVKQRLLLQREIIIGVHTKTVSQSDEVTVLAHRTVPFHLIRRVMASAASAGYSRVSLAVVQKAKDEG